MMSELRYHISRLIACCLPDKLYLSIKFRVHMGYWMNWDNPKTFNEKLQWLKIYYRRKDFSKLVDKSSVKDIIAKKIGAEHIIPTLAVYDDVEEIDFERLPDKFVLKCTHDSGGLVVCENKSKLNVSEAKRVLKKSLRTSYVVQNREYPYQFASRKIIAEKFMEEPEFGELRDFKFYCFDGCPKYLLVASGRRTGRKHFDYFDMDWNHLPVCDLGCTNSEHTPQKPENFLKMVEIARNLSKDIPHVRVDLYNVEGQIYFGEMTFFDGSGVSIYNPKEYDLIFGSYLKLPKPYNDIES